MQHAFSTRLASFAACLFLSSGALAIDATKMWSESDDYVKLEAVNATNNHPVVFSPEQLSNLLSRIYKREDDKTPQPYFSANEVERLSRNLLPLFAKAQPGDDVQFVTSFRPGGLFFMARELNAGLFVENGRLNLLAGMCGDAPDLAYYHATGNRRPINHGSRIKPVNGMGCTLLSGNGAEIVNNRPDWISIDISTALASEPPKAYQGGAAADSGTTFKPATLPAAAPAPLPSVAAPAPVAAPVVAPAAPVTQSAPSAPQAVLPAAPLSKAEERLMLLKRLKDNGLINDAEYEQKRAAIVKDL
jgi:hypothetical protein